MKILIILTRFNTDPYRYDPNNDKENHNYLMPIGLGYISEVLKEHEYDVDILNLNQKNGEVKQVIAETVIKTHYDLMFCGGTSIYYPNVRDIVNAVTLFSPDTKTVIGGGLVSAQPEIMFNLIRADYAIIGEGEITAFELVKAIDQRMDIHSVNGLMFREGGLTIRNKPRAPIMDLDSLPFPDLGSFGFSEFLEKISPGYIAYDYFDYPRPYPILGSRSCPYACTFCFHTIGNKYRHRSIGNIISEMKYAIDTYKVNVFFFYDELFAYDKARAMEFCRKLIELRKTIPYEIRLSLNLRVDCADEEVIDALKEAGCNIVGLGFESYSQTVLDSMKKRTTPEQILRTTRLIASRGLAVQGAFIFGDPKETLETAKETLDFFWNNQDILRGGVAIGFIIPFQGSPLYKYLVANGKIKDEIEFIKDRELNPYNYYRPINMTDTMSGSAFEELKDMVLTAVVAKRYAIPASICKEGGVNVITAKCPYCGEMNTYRNFDPPKMFETKNTGCRSCNGRFDMVTPLYPAIRFSVKTLGFKRMYRIKKLFRKIVGGGND